MPFEHKPWSVFGDADKIRVYNPLTRVPTLVLATGETLVETLTILDYLDYQVPASQALSPRAGPMRHRAMRISALASGLADLGVSLFYEQKLHAEPSEMLVARRRQQIQATLIVLNTECAGLKSDYWFGETVSHADIAVVAVWRHLVDSLPDLVIQTDYPALASFSMRLEALPVFKSIFQPFIAPA